MKMSTEEKKNGIQWTLWQQLDDLDFADDLALLSHTQQQIQHKTDTLSQSSTCIGLNIHRGKSKILRVNAVSDTPVMLAGQALEDVECFTYLGSIVDKQGGTDADVRTRIQRREDSISSAEKHLGLNSPDSQLQNQDIQHHREAHPTVWLRDMENDCHHHEENSNLHQHLS